MKTAFSPRACIARCSPSIRASYSDFGKSSTLALALGVGRCATWFDLAAVTVWSRSCCAVPRTSRNRISWVAVGDLRVQIRPTVGKDWNHGSLLHEIGAVQRTDNHLFAPAG